MKKENKISEVSGGIKTASEVLKNKKKHREQIGTPFFADRKNVLRLVLFLIALTIALTSIGYGVYRIGYKEEGAYEIKTDPDGDLPFYASGITLTYNFTGKSSEIKELMSEIKTAYSASLIDSYKLFDPENSYPGVNNIAYINETPGFDIAVSDELYSVLSDAWAKTNEGMGYTVFAGMFKGFRNNLIYGYEHDASDPLYASDFNEMLAELTDLIYSEGAAKLSFDSEKKTVRLDISAELKAFIDRIGIEFPLLDLDLLYDAYRVQMAAKTLESMGYNNGYISTDSGISLSLSGNTEVEYCFYSYDGNSAALSATKRGEPGSSASFVRVFAFDENEEGFYTIEHNGAKVYRHMYMTDFSERQVLSSALTKVKSHKIADAVYANIVLLSCKTADKALDYAKKSGMDTLFAFIDEENVIYAASSEGLSIDTDGGYELKSP